MRRLPRIVLSVVALGAAALGVRADFTAADALASAPAEVRGPLSASKVADLVEYAKVGMFSHTERNAVDAEARIWTLDSIHAELQTEPGRVVSIELLPLKSDTVIAVIETLTSSDVADSRMTVYSRKWQPMPKLWAEPKPSEWGKVEPLPLLFISYAYEPAHGLLVLTNNSESTDGMLKQMHYKWTPKGFKRLKQ